MLNINELKFDEKGLIPAIVVDAITKASFQKEETKLAIKEAVVKAMGRDVGVKYDNLK